MMRHIHHGLDLACLLPFEHMRHSHLQYVKASHHAYHDNVCKQNRRKHEHNKMQKCKMFSTQTVCHSSAWPIFVISTNLITTYTQYLTNHYVLYAVYRCWKYHTILTSVQQTDSQQSNTAKYNLTLLSIRLVPEMCRHMPLFKCWCLEIELVPSVTHGAVQMHTQSSLSHCACAHTCAG